MSKYNKASHPSTTPRSIDVKLQTISCPGCKKKIVYTLTNPFRPFCSASCKNNDFSAWADEAFRIATKDSLVDSDL